MSSGAKVGRKLPPGAADRGVLDVLMEMVVSQSSELELAARNLAYWLELGALPKPDDSRMAAGDREAYSFPAEIRS